MIPSTSRMSLLYRTLLSLFSMFFLTSPVLSVFAAASAAPSQPETGNSPYLFGVVNDNGDHITDLWNRGARIITFELKWKLYQPAPDTFDSNYISHMKQRLTALKRQGWTVQLVPGYHYVPQWVFDTYPDMAYVNQFGQAYSPDPTQFGDFRVINAPFNPEARSLIAAYLKRLFQDFDQTNPDLQFDSIRIGGGPQGELRYPHPDWGGHANSYWAFDADAQDPAKSGIPMQVIGWRPGIDANPGTLGRGQLLVNPGFERIEPGFTVFAWSPDEEVSASFTDDAHSGGQALRLEISSKGRIHQFVRVTPGASYDLGGWLMSGDGNGQARIIVTQYDASNNLLPGAPFTKLENRIAAWQKRSGTITTTPGTHFLKFALDGDQPGAYFFDDLWLKASGETNIEDRDVDVPLAFYNWYVDSLTRYQTWQINEFRKYSSGRLDLVYAGKGISPTQVTDALNNDLQGDIWSEASSGLYSASDYPRHIAAAAASPGPFSVYLTGMEVPAADKVDDYSPYPGDWSAARWLSYLAQQNHLPIWGENTGENDYPAMQLSAERMRRNSFFSMMWAFESELYSGKYATAAEYEGIIQRFNAQHYVYLPEVSLQ